MEDFRNIHDKFKGWTQDLIKETIQQNTFPYAVMMSQIGQDFNIGTVVRSANAFGVREIFYYGKKSWDRRGAVGTQVYSSITFLKSFEMIQVLKEKYVFVGLEQNEKSVDLRKFVWPEKPFLIIIGEEGNGLSEEMLNLCDFIVEISQFGSVRSVNAGVAGSIAMYDYLSKRVD